ncbi:MAG: DedA family protein [Treponematales bacterium]
MGTCFSSLYKAGSGLDFFALLSAHIAFFPFAAFAALLLAGVNVPVSEDLVIITGAMLSRESPERLPANMLGIYAGVLLSDLISYGLGRGVRRGTKAAAAVERAIPPAALDKMRALIGRFGALTFIVCRFIPFGVRNTLFISSGLSGLSLKRFLFFDIPASLISVNTLFFLVFRFGDIIEKPFRAAGGWLFALLLAAALAGTVIALARRRHLLKKESPEPC